ncbi:calcium and integrin-binding protein 1 [Aethina tumida]|uniref:calcium and integrin-binding protein 1 n=1 Tax=Aethina tumida TaxID=116153 RepID=UPI00096AF463|nr:calcium and integrin-binding protein 1 [Aethina tumida]
MGTSSSVLDKSLLDEYSALTYLTKSEIIRLYKFVCKGNNSNVNDICLTKEDVDKIFPQLKVNPFRDRIFKVFADNENSMSFENILDLCSVMSENCPEKVKAAWGFKIFDFDEDNEIGKDDLKNIIHLLTTQTNSSGHQGLSDSEMERIIKTLIEGMDLEENDYIGQIEFTHALGKLTDFASSFTFRF